MFFSIVNYNLIVLNSPGMVTISSLQALEEKTESAVGAECFWHCSKCFGSKQGKPNTDTGENTPFNDSSLVL